MTLTVSDFNGFVRAVHGHGPFPWQQALLERVAEVGWPDVIDVPTGLGKTSVLDVAVFARALGVPAARLRTYLVIDRRIVVDQAFEHARAIEQALREPTDEVVSAVATLLRPAPTAGISPPPLCAARLRGGLTWSWRWLDRPDQPAIVVGTVDQLGSRLLFRGYGVGEHLRSIDAALVGADSLFVVDEAHLAEPLITTLDRARALTDSANELSVAAPTVVVMSATVERAGAAHRITDRDRSDPVAAERLAAPKSLHLVEVAVRRSGASADIAKVLARAAHQLADDGADVVGVVANTVATAREAHHQLNVEDGRAVLLTGRQRTLDRDLILDVWAPRMTAGRSRHEGDPLFVVATQTIEVGADLDFGGLVTESASLDALVQRLGRLNRRGTWDHAPAVVVHAAGLEDDPIYGPARAATWRWLTTLVDPAHVKPSGRAPDLGDAIDASPGAWATLTAGLSRERRTELRPPRPVAPILFRWILDCWSETSPAPMHSPPVGPFLHGIERDQPTVSLLWRAVAGTEDALMGSIETLPAALEEQIEVPLVAARRWLSGDDELAAAVPDLESFTTPDDTFGTSSTSVLRISGPEARMVGASEIRPGDVLVVPSAAGGLDEYGWAPGSHRPVVDIADLARRRRSSSLRIDPTTLRALLRRERFDDVDPETALSDLDLSDPRDAAGTVVRRLDGALAGRGQLGALVRRVADGRAIVDEAAEPLDGSPDAHGRWPATWRVIVTAGSGGWQSDRDAAGSTAMGSQVTLAVHHRAVRERAEVFGRAIGLDGAVLAAVVDAAGWHDLGKCDPRFQAMLRGGVPAFDGDPLLAKSGMDPADRPAFRLAAQRSGYPSGMRHEAFSAQALFDRVGHAEHDLLVHLVASHHGRSRPLLPPVTDDEPIEFPVDVDGRLVVVRSYATVDWASPRRFRQLNERFGPWGLALLETIVRLADIACSEEGT